MNYFEDFLEQHDVKPTAIRLLIIKAIAEFSETFSMMDLEAVLDTVDKSTIFRTLSLFAEHHVVHAIDDGSGSVKYCMCHNTHTCSVEELHCHFHCEVCGKTFCLTHTLVPPVFLPEGFAAHQVNYLIKGICPACGKRKSVVH